MTVLRSKLKNKARKPGRPRRVMWFVYMIECTGQRIYTGITPDVAARFEKHKSGRGAAFTRINPPLRVLAAKRCGSRSQALKTEYRLKQRTRADKLRWADRHGSHLRAERPDIFLAIAPPTAKSRPPE